MLSLWSLFQGPKCPLLSQTYISTISRRMSLVDWEALSYNYLYYHNTRYHQQCVLEQHNDSWCWVAFGHFYNGKLVESHLRFACLWSALGHRRYKHEACLKGDFPKSLKRSSSTTMAPTTGGACYHSAGEVSTITVSNPGNREQRWLL